MRPTGVNSRRRVVLEAVGEPATQESRHVDLASSRHSFPGLGVTAARTTATVLRARMRQHRLVHTAGGSDPDAGSQGPVGPRRVDTKKEAVINLTSAVSALSPWWPAEMDVPSFPGLAGWHWQSLLRT